MLILPIARSSATLAYYHSLDLHALQHGNVEVVAMDFGMLLLRTLLPDVIWTEMRFKNFPWLWICYINTQKSIFKCTLNWKEEMLPCNVESYSLLLKNLVSDVLWTETEKYKHILDVESGALILKILLSNWSKETRRYPVMSNLVYYCSKVYCRMHHELKQWGRKIFSGIESSMFLLKSLLSK